MYLQMFRKKTQRGFYLIGLLMALVIVAILYGKQLMPDKEKPLLVTKIDQSQGTACAMNRSTLSTNLTAWRINHMNEAPTIEKLRQEFMSVPSCPDGGIIEIAEDGGIYCSKHYPRPTPSPAAMASPPNPN